MKVFSFIILACMATCILSFSSCYKNNDLDVPSRLDSLVLTENVIGIYSAEVLTFKWRVGAPNYDSTYSTAKIEITDTPNTDKLYFTDGIPVYTGEITPYNFDWTTRSFDYVGYQTLRYYAQIRFYSQDSIGYFKQTGGLGGGSKYLCSGRKD